MLKQRVITALILIPLLIGTIFFLSSQALALILAVFVLLGAWEWSALSGLQSILARLVYVALYTLGLGWVWSMLLGCAVCVGGLLAIAGLWWLGVFFWMLRHPGPRWELGSWAKGVKGIAGLLTLIPAWSAILWLRTEERYGPTMVIFVLLLVWVADSGAYFAGKRWGRERLAPTISPGKTREGVYGACGATLVLSLGVGFVGRLTAAEIGGLAVLSMLTVLFSILGDLFESLIKRQAGVKDSGRLLPGHGGVLDRIDSLTAAAPVFALGLLITGFTP